MSDTMELRVLVTGASGFVGGALMGRLRREPGIAPLGIGRRGLDDPDYSSLDLTAPDAASRLAALRWPAGVTTGVEHGGGPDDRGASDRGHDDRGPDDRGPEDRGHDDRGPEDRGPEDRGHEDRGPDDRGPDDRGPDDRWPDDRGPDVIVHAAARSSPWGTRAEFERENVEATRAVLDYARRLPRRPRVVFVSTASVLYRAHDQFEVPDDAPTGRPFVNWYASTKHAAEELVRSAGGDWVVLRPRAVFGPGDTTLFPRIVEAARGGRLPRLRARGGRPVVSDLVPVETLVEYLLRACREPAVLGRTLTVTGGEAVELEPAVRGILSAAGVPYPAREVPRALALAAATVVETAWRVTRRRMEPPITRYSVIVYAYSKTFDGRACHELLGPPPVTVHAALAAFTAGLAEGVGRSDGAGGATS
jgi:nucleoside-diphosphate-sugar epimerase